MTEALSAFSAEFFPYIKFIHVFFAFMWGLAVPPCDGHATVGHCLRHSLPDLSKEVLYEVYQ